MDNFTIKAKYEEVCVQQEQKIEAMQQQLMEQDDRKLLMENEEQDVIDELEAELDKKIKRKQELEDKLRDLTYKVTDMNASHQTLIEQQTEKAKRIIALKAEKIKIDERKARLLQDLHLQETSLRSLREHQQSLS